MKSREFKRIWGFSNDFSYLLNIEQRKLKEMATYFNKSRLNPNWKRQVKECNLCVKLLDIALQKDKDYKIWLNSNFIDNIQLNDSPFPVYININNSNRFMFDVNGYPKELMEMMKSELRSIKAFYLYQKIRLYKMMTWWS